MARKKRESDTAKTREQLVQIADDLIAQHGLSAMSVSAVAREMGMSHANIYKHFRSKDDLIAAVALSWMGEMQNACETAVDCEDSPAERLAQLVLTIRSQMLKRAKNIGALDLYQFAREKLPEAAAAHHRHRLNLVTRLTGDPEVSLAVLDGLRGFTDPHLLVETEERGVDARIQRLTSLLARTFSPKLQRA